jgi:hypothetical protein
MILEVIVPSRADFVEALISKSFVNSADADSSGAGSSHMED